MKTTYSQRTWSDMCNEVDKSLREPDLSYEFDYKGPGRWGRTFYEPKTEQGEE